MHMEQLVRTHKVVLLLTHWKLNLKSIQQCESFFRLVSLAVKPTNLCCCAAMGGPSRLKQTGLTLKTVDMEVKIDVYGFVTFF